MPSRRFEPNWEAFNGEGSTLVRTRDYKYKQGSESPDFLADKRPPAEILAELDPLLSQIPGEEYDVVRLRIEGVREESIGKLLGITQATVSVRWYRAEKRLQFLRVRGPIPGTLEDFERVTAGLLVINWPHSPPQAPILYDWLLTTNQSTTARKMGLTQFYVSKLVRRGIRMLYLVCQGQPMLTDGILPWLRALVLTRQHPNILSYVATGRPNPPSRRAPGNGRKGRASRSKDA